MAKLESDISRRETLKVIAGFVGRGLAAKPGDSPQGGKFQLSPFTEDVTPPVGNPVFGGRPARATVIVDRLEANGLVLCGPGKPIVLVAVDWCEICNESYERWRSVLAEAAGTDKERVLIAF